MNEHHLPPDELASAFLDDELAETETIDRDPEIAARADALRRAADAVGEPVTPPPGAEDSAVAAALADFDARQVTRLDPERRRPRSLPVVTGIAAAVAVGFIVAAAVGLFADSDSDNESVASAPPPPAAPAPSPEAAPEAPPPPPAEPAPALAEDEPPTFEEIEATAAEALAAAEEALAAADLAQATAEGNEAAVAAAEAALATAHAAADEARAEAAAAQAEADEARAEAAAAQAEAAAAQAEAAAAQAEADEAQSAAAAAEPAAAPADDVGEMTADDMDPPADVDGGPPAEHCASAVDDGTVELRITVDETPVLIIRTIDERLVAINGTTCGEIPPAQPPDALYPLPPESCAAAVGDGRVALHIIVGETPVLIIRTVDGRLSGLAGDTCSEFPPAEPG